MSPMPDPHAWDPQPAKFTPTPLPPDYRTEYSQMIDMILAIRTEENERLEALIMECLADPRRPGIAVIEHDEIIDIDTVYRVNGPSYRIESRTEMRLDTNVPDMQIFRFPSPRSYDAWARRGCPVD